MFAHWLTLETTFIVHNAWLLVSRGDPQRMMDVAELTIGNAGFTLVTLFAVGWLTIPIGCIPGGLLIALQRRELARAAGAAG
jgi:hypothetical protein